MISVKLDHFNLDLMISVKLDNFNLDPMISAKLDDFNLDLMISVKFDHFNLDLMCCSWFKQLLTPAGLIITEPNSTLLLPVISRCNDYIVCLHNFRT